MPAKIAFERTELDVFHPGQPTAQSHPDRLATIASLFGMQPAPIDRCRVLELGCGAGANLLPMAQRHPDSTFVGISGSLRQVQQARQSAQEHELGNVQFEELAPGRVGEQLGMFDYVISHDQFSRVPSEEQEGLLTTCRAALAPQGVAYVSFRSLPGSLWPEIVGQGLLGSITQGASLAAGLAEARRRLQFLAGALSAEDSAYGRMMLGEAELALHLSDLSLLHEHFAAEIHACYFHEFMERAAAHSLAYLGDADFSTMFAANMGPLVEGNLLQVAEDAVALEQYMDVLRNRAFHRTLLCREEVRLERRLFGERLTGLWLAGNLRPEDAQAEDLSGAPRRFITFNGSLFSAAVPAVEAALLELGRAWPRSLPYADLVDLVQTQLESRNPPLTLGEAERQMLAETLAECLATGFIQAHADADRFVTTLSERPLASRWTRTEARTPGFATNRRHEPVPLDELSQNLLRYLDGEHDRAALLAVLREAAASGQMSILQSGIPAAAQAAIPLLEQVLDQSLVKLVRSALLIA